MQEMQNAPKNYKITTWDDLTDSQKINRMRDIIKSLQYDIRFLQKNIRLMQKHIHSLDGSVVVPFDSANSADNYCIKSESSDEWF